MVIEPTLVKDPTYPLVIIFTSYSLSISVDLFAATIAGETFI